MNKKVKIITYSVKKATLLILATAAVCSAMFIISFSVQNLVVKVDIIKLNATETKTTVLCSGVIQSGDNDSVFYSIPLKAANVRVKIGDSVKAGQTLIDVDTSDTVQTFVNVYSKNYKSDDAQQVSGYTDLSSLSGLSGLSSTSGNLNSLLQNYKDVLAKLQSSNSNIGTAVNNESENLEYPEIPSFVKSPITGVVTDINIENGSYSQPDMPVITVSNLKQMQVKVQVDELLIKQIKTGQRAEIKGNGFGTAYSGIVTQIYPTARQIITSAGTRTVVDVVITVQNPKSDLKPGLTADADIITAVNNKACTVPYEAINQDGSREYVYLYKNGKAYKTYITTGNEYDDYIEVKSGLKDGDTVVVNPSAQLKNGSRIKELSIQAYPS